MRHFCLCNFGRLDQTFDNPFISPSLRANLQPLAETCKFKTSELKRISSERTDLNTQKPGNSKQDQFFNLDPELIMASAERFGFRPTGELIQLNSYENRVFDIKLEDAPHSVIAKFYRPNRWSKEAILDEHDFLQELKSEGIEVAEPLKEPSGATLIESSDILCAFFPKIRGRMIQEFNMDNYKSIGRLIARVHNVGQRKICQHRFRFDHTHPGGEDGIEFLQPWISPEVRGRYNESAELILDYLHENVSGANFFRVHGDTHRGNLLKTEDDLFIVDFDDFGLGPAVQDLWMLLPAAEANDELESFLEGYTELRKFDRNELAWIPALRGLRILSYASWIARRWKDPSFPKLFPNFGEYTYWAEEVEALEKIAWQL